MSEQTLNEAAGVFLASLEESAREASRPVVLRFVAWYGREKPLAALNAPEVARYAGQMSRAEVDFTRKMALLRSFLSFIHKNGWLESNMAVHLKAARKTAPAVVRHRPRAKPVSETKEGLEKMQGELAELKKKRLKTVDDVRLAAADKDFRENAPFHAAREQLSHIDGRIKQLEAGLKNVVVVDKEAGRSARIGLGDSIVLSDLTSGEELRYTIVGPREVDPSRGRLSGTSPIGKAVLGRSAGEEIEVAAPAGKRRYRIENIGR